jgi:hypothetical protein
VSIPSLSSQLSFIIVTDKTITAIMGDVTDETKPSHNHVDKLSIANPEEGTVCQVS